MAQCKACDAEILFFETEDGKKMPVDATPMKRVVQFRRGDTVLAKMVDTYTPHWASCAYAKRFRKGAKPA